MMIMRYICYIFDDLRCKDMIHFVCVMYLDSLDILYILYIGFLSIFMQQCVYLMLLLLQMFKKLKKNEYFSIFLVCRFFPDVCRCFGEISQNDVSWTLSIFSLRRCLQHWFHHHLALHFIVLSSRPFALPRKGDFLMMYLVSCILHHVESVVKSLGAMSWPLGD